MGASFAMPRLAVVPANLPSSRFGLGDRRVRGVTLSAARRDQRSGRVSGMENFERRVAVQFAVFPLRVFG